MDSPAINPTPFVRVYLDGVLQSRVVAFNTRSGYLARYVQNDGGEWVVEDCRGVVHADCDTASKTTQAFGSGEGTN